MKKLTNAQFEELKPIFDKRTVALIIANELYEINKKDEINIFYCVGDDCIERAGKFRTSKLLYLAYAIWAGRTVSDNETDIEMLGEIANTVLFGDANFEAWKYGPVEADIYWEIHDGTLGEYATKFKFKAKNNLERDAERYIRDLVREAGKMSDFNIVDRTQADRVWKNKYEEGFKHKINTKKLITDYVNKTYLTKEEEERINNEK